MPRDGGERQPCGQTLQDSLLALLNTEVFLGGEEGGAPVSILLPSLQHGDGHAAAPTLLAEDTVGRLAPAPATPGIILARTNKYDGCLQLDSNQ